MPGLRVTRSAGRTPAGSLAKRLLLATGVVLIVAVLVFAVGLAWIGSPRSSSPRASEPPTREGTPPGGYTLPPSGNSSASGSSPCGGNLSHPCTLAPRGTNWTLSPPTSWCVVVTSSQGIEWSCSAAPVELYFNASTEAELRGSLWLSGPSHVLLVASGTECESLWALSPYVGAGCALSIGPVPAYAWNETFSTSINLNLSSLAFNFTGAPGILPAGAPLALVIVDDGATNETATATTDIVLSGLGTP
jgi:hypothetical protein